MGEMSAWVTAVPVETEPWEKPHLGDHQELLLLLAKDFVKYSIHSKPCKYSVSSISC